MKRNNRFVKHNDGRWIFLITGVIITVVLYIFASSEEPKVYASEEVQPEIKVIDRRDRISENDNQESEMAQMGNVEETAVHNFQEPLGMSAKAVLLDREYEEQLAEIGFTQEEILLLERITFAEARGEGIEGQIGVVNVILNRVESKAFPNTVSDVIFDTSNGVKQFSPTSDGEIYWTDNDGERRTVLASDIIPKTEDAVEQALAGENPIGKRKFFYSPRGCSEEELEKRANIEDALPIGNLIFYGE